MKFKFLTVIISFLMLFSCKKEQQTEIRILPKTSTAPITLSIDKAINDSTLVLKWNKFTGTGFKSYVLTRSSKIFKNGSFIFINEILKNLTSIDSLTYFEGNMPYTTDVLYSINVITDAEINSLNATLTYKRTDTYLNGRFSDALIDQQQKTVYLIDHQTGDIIAYNYETNKKITAVKLNTAVGFAALGNFEGASELYVPTEDGWLQILDPANLTLKERIYVGGRSIGSVIATSGKLIISSSDLSFQSMDSKAIKIYDRKTKEVTGHTGYWEYTRLLLLENSNTEFIDITFNILPTQLSYYKIGSDGLPVNSFNDNYHGDYPVDGNIVRSFPDGQKFITSSSGTVYTKGLVFEKNLAFAGSSAYSDYAFNNAGSIIYCAFNFEKKIQAISYPSLTPGQTFQTKLYPRKVFRDGNQLICISRETTNFYSSESIIFIEKFNL
jgi:hypothetical protein